MKHGVLLFVCSGIAALACSREPAQEPQQPYYQQPPPQQQPYPAQPAPAETVAPAPVPAATTPAPAGTTPAPAGSGTATPTAIPGVMKNADGTCSITPPGGAPINGPCPPGI